MDDKKIGLIRLPLNIKEIRDVFLKDLCKIYDREEVMSFFYWLSEHILNYKRVDVALFLNKELSTEELHAFTDAKKRLVNQEPIQHIVGYAWFCNMIFEVNKHVLIPRPETEELVISVKNHWKSEANIKVLDIGTGSGCIAISLAKYLKNAEIQAVDISSEALKIAKRNAIKNEVEIMFIQQDILQLEKLPHKIDVIISNPPYVRELEKEEIKANVLDYEPHGALFVTNNDPLVFYKKIAQLAKKALTERGMLYFEINQYLGKETVDMIKEIGFNKIKLHQDMFGNDRMIQACLQ